MWQVVSDVVVLAFKVSKNSLPKKKKGTLHFLINNIQADLHQRAICTDLRFQFRTGSFKKLGGVLKGFQVFVLGNGEWAKSNNEFITILRCTRYKTQRRNENQILNILSP